MTDTLATESPAEGGAEDSEELSLLRDDAGGKQQRSVHFKEAPPSRRSASQIRSPLNGVKKFVSNATHLVADNVCSLNVEIGIDILIHSTSNTQA